LSATFIVAHTSKGLPGVTGFDETFVMAALFLTLGVAAGLIVPEPGPPRASLALDAKLAPSEVS
jgi:hypothetical protein